MYSLCWTDVYTHSKLSYRIVNNFSAYLLFFFYFIYSCIDLQYCVLFRNLPPQLPKLPYDFSYGNNS